MPRTSPGDLEPERDWFDEQIDAFKWRNAQRAQPDYSLEYDSVLGPEVQNARGRYLETMAEHEREQKRQRFGRRGSQAS